MESILYDLLANIFLLNSNIFSESKYIDGDNVSKLKFCQDKVSCRKISIVNFILLSYV